MAGAPISKSRRLRSTPYTDRVEANGVTGYTIYNHMLLPTAFASLEDDYTHLKKYAQIWDVAAERQVQLKGPDARKLAVLMSARDLTKAQPGRCYYAPILDHKGGFINDPIALCLADDLFWFSIADGDMLYWAMGLATGLGLDVEVTEPDVSPLAVQGPMAEDLMVDVFGEEIRGVGFFKFKAFPFKGRMLNIARSGWSKQGGFEIYLDDSALGGDLWDAIWEKGEPYNLRAGCPNLIERIEGGLFGFGNDMTSNETPLEIGLEKFISLDADYDFIGKEALLAQRAEGVKRKLKGIRISGSRMKGIPEPQDCFVNGVKVGFATSGVYSPDFGTNIAFAMVDIDHAENGSVLDMDFDGSVVSTDFDGETRKCVVCDIPFTKE